MKKPLNTDMDAERWAAEFMEKFGDKKEQIDHGLMLAWFANAIMCGYDNAHWEIEERDVL